MMEGHQILLSEVGLKHPRATVEKSHGGERWAKTRTRSEPMPWGLNVNVIL